MRKLWGWHVSWSPDLGAWRIDALRLHDCGDPGGARRGASGAASRSARAQDFRLVAASESQAPRAGDGARDYRNHIQHV